MNRWKGRTAIVVISLARIRVSSSAGISSSMDSPCWRWRHAMASDNSTNWRKNLAKFNSMVRSFQWSVKCDMRSMWIQFFALLASDMVALTCSSIMWTVWRREWYLRTIIRRVWGKLWRQMCLDCAMCCVRQRSWWNHDLRKERILDTLLISHQRSVMQSELWANWTTWNQSMHFTQQPSEWRLLSD